MKKALILLTSAIAMLAIASAAGCSGGDDDDDDDDDGGSLVTGTYAASGASITDTCSGATDSYYAGVTEANVTVTGLSILISGFPDDLGYDISGSDLVDNTFGTPSTGVLDFRDNAGADYPLDSGNEYSCVAELFTEYAGTINGQNSLTLHDTFTATASATSGAGCTVAIVSSAYTAAGLQPLDAFPCELHDGVDLDL